MKMDLANGVHFKIIPTKKYKTVRFAIKFKTDLSAENITMRALLSSLLETNSKKYPTQTAFRSELADLYGASFSTSINKKGTKHVLNLSLNIVNDRFLQHADGLSVAALAFLKEVIFFPNVKDGAFDEETFQREKENLADYYASIIDDKQAYASLQLQDAYFQGSQKIPGSGRAADLPTITAEKLYTYYQKMLAEDEIDIYILGDVDEGQMTKLVKDLPFSSRETSKTSVFYHQERADIVTEKIEKQDVTQAKHNLLYRADIYFLQENYFAGQVFNGLFGGFPHSKLFMNVREKESLAYYASSQLDTFRGTMLVQTGIETEKMVQVQRIIAAQLKDLQNGLFSEENFNQTKEMFKNQVLQSEDSGIGVIEKTYSRDLAQKAPLTIEEWFNQIDQVTREDVIAVANQVQLQATFFLSGEDETNA